MWEGAFHGVGLKKIGAREAISNTFSAMAGFLVPNAERLPDFSFGPILRLSTQHRSRRYLNFDGDE
jgi:hypothetical protein